MVSVSERVEMHKDAKVVVEEQNIQIDPQIDEELNEPHVSKKVRLHEDAEEAIEEQFVGIDTSHVSKKVGLHENAQEANEGQTGVLEVDMLPLIEQVETHEDAQVSLQEQNIEIEPPKTTLGVYVLYPHFADLHPNGSKWKVKARLVRMVEVMNPLLPSVTLRLVCLEDGRETMRMVQRMKVKEP
ncbi:hypothetical protein RHSIM_Rhsim05G0101500 [Rhododendron simsii]|uniref:Uncharacterized protein n=1 Tax=Rhododendron simsii TaxID=118357 RepID=A0A834GV47_RHOSS|nr:hypothetical protein RHSIM_Rhsim05G0101500 [Rhododendron simsii]